MRIYISGKISGLSKDEYETHFREAEKKLETTGHSVINPAKVNGMLPDDTSYEEYMKMSMCMLSMCDAIYMLDNWRDSPGAKKELEAAMANGMPVLHEERK